MKGTTMSDQNENIVIEEDATPVRFRRLKKVLSKIEENSAIIAIATATAVSAAGIIALNRLDKKTTETIEVAEPKVIETAPTED
ncbi:gp063 [Rhodococcus phage ReqiPoco6]|uniref:Gp063 n=1 Tax=Rhodococcus phage ReqiPoco6 TaxID=691964 RepID=D4P7T1_9CAUD|nr:gp063 [Rhodococcus phage ReqiPoco6]ADD81061.1 gp063 [Rhodococcus phage ReqiPoco6]